MKCINCGNEVSNNDAVCPVCGTTREMNQQLQNSVNNVQGYDNQQNHGGFCMFCGRPIPSGFSVCSECAARDAIDTSSTSKKKVPVLLIVLIAVFSLLLGGVIVGFVSGYIPELLFVDTMYDDISSSDEDEEEDDSDAKKAEDEAEEEENIEEEEPEEEPEPLPEPEPEYIQHEVYPYSSDVTWEQANAIARGKGGYVAIPNSKAEFDELCRLASSQKLDAFWIGVKRESYQSWYDVYIPYENWLVTGNGAEPSEYDRNAYDDRGEYIEECYLMALKTSSGWRMNDTPNDISAAYKRVGFMIERDEY